MLKFGCNVSIFALIALINAFSNPIEQWRIEIGHISSAVEYNPSEDGTNSYKK